jgi:hypothetical protein
MSGRFAAAQSPSGSRAIAAVSAWTAAALGRPDRRAASCQGSNPSRTRRLARRSRHRRVAVPIYQTTSYQFDSTEHAATCSR